MNHNEEDLFEDITEWMLRYKRFYHQCTQELKNNEVVIKGLESRIRELLEDYDKETLKISRIKEILEGVGFDTINSDEVLVEIFKIVKGVDNDDG